MAIRITIPGIIRLAWVTDPDEVVAANDCGAVQRSLSGLGGLVQRSIAAKLAVFRTPEGDVWPAFRDRADPLRMRSHDDLEEALSHTRTLLKRVAPETGAQPFLPPPLFTELPDPPAVAGGIAGHPDRLRTRPPQ